MNNNPTTLESLLGSETIPEGVDIGRYLTPVVDTNGALTSYYMEVKYREALFILKRPGWSIQTQIVSMTPEICTYEARIYSPEQMQLAVSNSERPFMVNRHATRMAADGPRYADWAETAAVGRALAALGFGRLYGPSDDNPASPVDQPVAPPVPQPVEQPMNAPAATQPTAQAAPSFGEPAAAVNQFTPPAVENSFAAPTVPQIVPPAPMQTAQQGMTLAEALAFIIPIGKSKGNTVDSLDIEALQFFAEQYAGKRNDLRTAAQIVFEEKSKKLAAVN